MCIFVCGLYNTLFIQFILGTTVDLEIPIFDSFPLLVNIANTTYILEIAHFQVLSISPVDVFFVVISSFLFLTIFLFI